MSENDEFDDEHISEEAEIIPRKPRYMGDLLGLYSPLSVDVRGTDAYHAAVKFFTLIQTEVKDPEWQKKLVQAWIAAVRNRNYSRFAKEYRRWKRSLITPETPTTMNGSENA